MARVIGGGGGGGVIDGGGGGGGVIDGGGGGGRRSPFRLELEPPGSPSSKGEGKSDSVLYVMEAPGGGVEDEEGAVVDDHLHLTVSDSEPVIVDWIASVRRLLPQRGQGKMALGLQIYMAGGDSPSLGLLGLAASGRKALIIPMETIKSDHNFMKLVGAFLNEYKVAVGGANLEFVKRVLKGETGIELKDAIDVVRIARTHYDVPPLNDGGDDLQIVCYAVLRVVIPNKSGRLKAGMCTSNEAEAVGFVAAEAHVVRLLLLEIYREGFLKFPEHRVRKVK